MEQLQQFYKNKRVLVTGGAGFIGSHLVEKLVELGAQVTILDNFSTGKLRNLHTVLSKINILYSDIRSEYSTRKATAHKDIVFHLAAFISVPLSVQNPDFCRNTNELGTRYLLEGCLQNEVKSFVFASSSAVYGNKNAVCTEDDPVDPQSPYAHSKVVGEYYCKKYALEGEFNTAALRYFNVYGSRQNPNGDYAAVVAKFKHNLLAGQPLTIFGDGSQRRDFVHVSEVVDANLKVAMLPRVRGDIFNVGSGKSMTIFDLIASLEEELQVKRTEITFAPARTGDILYSQASCEKYKNTVL